MHVAKSDVLIFQNALTNNYIAFFIAHKGHEQICALSFQVLNKYRKVKKYGVEKSFILTETEKHPIHTHIHKRTGA